MRATDILMSEHRRIERVLDAMEKAADHLGRGGAVRPEFFLEAAEFIAGFADGLHHHKEEDILFPALVRAGLPGEAGPVAVMLVEHEQGRRLTAQLRAAATRLAGGDAAAAGPLGAAVRGYTGLLRDHIAKEDHVLFPMAGQVLSAGDESQVDGQFARAEQEENGGAAARFLALADALVSEAASLA